MKYTPYSFSKINCYKTCPKQFENRYITRQLADDSYQRPTFFERGSFVHDYIARRLEGGTGEMYGYNTVEVDDKMKLMEDADKALENDYVAMTFNFKDTKVEGGIRLDENLLPTTQGGHTVTGKVDYYAVEKEIGSIIDWKSGNYQSESNFEQLELYALWIFQTYPAVTEVDLVFYYLEHQKFNVKTVTFEDVILFRNNLADNIGTIESTTKFEVKPSSSCKYCMYIDDCKDKYGINP